VAGREARAQLVDLLQKPVGLENLVRKRGEGEVKVVVDLGVFEALGLGDGGPDPGQVLDQGVTEVGQRRVSDVVADDEEEEGPCLRSGILSAPPKVEK
jgi:hypothetical protein